MAQPFLFFSRFSGEKQSNAEYFKMVVRGLAVGNTAVCMKL
jgi:hypothetical protein